MSIGFSALHNPVSETAAMTPQAPAAPRDTAPRSVIRIIQILEYLASSPEGYSLTGLSEKLHTPKSSLLNLLRGLVAARYVNYVDNLYTLGAESYRLATTISGSRRFLPIARPIMQRLTELTGETVLIATLTPDKNSIVYIDKVESQNPFRFAVAIGEPRPLHSTAAGRAILAFQPAALLSQLLRDLKLTAFTQHTVTDKRVLRQRLDEVKSQSYAVTLGETNDAVVGFAAPILDETGAAMAALVIACPTERAVARKKELIKLVTQAGREISAAMGYRSSAK
jgi:IclR family pca regulon transcriptional regulator